ncbi:class I SAM-dependent methyltransferase [Aeromonas salmonicida]|uniref:Class I SAM-dependent methyltransferase n=1 Tax=Aeromonas salmonicida TaxID=645 RepID=A0AAX3VVC8_AERSA|nr:class I SAM-dependent methyltransferase [Aeromonas salmonicida]WHF36658.1 class I SAM-dependent methyltransferase [Aeromonas salmonicida]
MSISPLPNYDASPSHDASSSLPSVADPGTLSARQRFLKQLAAGAHLLEAGCGAGEDLLFFRQQGFMVTAFDASLAQAKLASRRCSQPVRVCRFEQMHNVLPFDGIWASGSLPCLVEEELAPALMHLASLLKPRAPLYCSFPYDEGKSGNPVASSQDEYPLQTRLDEARLQQLIATLPFDLHQSWSSEDAVHGRWLHALLIRFPELAPTKHQYRRRRFKGPIPRNSSSS